MITKPLYYFSDQFSSEHVSQVILDEGKVELEVKVFFILATDIEQVCFKFLLIFLVISQIDDDGMVLQLIEGGVDNIGFGLLQQGLPPGEFDGRNGGGNGAEIDFGWRLVHISVVAPVGFAFSGLGDLAVREQDVVQLGLRSLPYEPTHVLSLREIVLVVVFSWFHRV